MFVFPVYLAGDAGIASGLVIIQGTTYRIGQVGSFVRIPQGYQDLFGIVSEVGANATPEAETASTHKRKAARPTGALLGGGRRKTEKSS